MQYDVTIVTATKYLSPKNPDQYLNNILLEDKLLMDALGLNGLHVNRIGWDDTEFDWGSTRSVVIRATWDYFYRIDEFRAWIEMVSTKTYLINPKPTLLWNIDKHYLLELSSKGINVPPTKVIESGDTLGLKKHITQTGWEQCVLKPAISGAGKHTYLLNKSNINTIEETYDTLIKSESFLIQEYLQSITSKGEITLVMLGGKFSHAVLKRAKAGDFRVQDDFGGTVHHYTPTKKEVAFAEQVMQCLKQPAIYGRVDIVWDNNGQMAVSELELIEPELWLRNDENAARRLACAIIDYLPQP